MPDPTIDIPTPIGGDGDDNTTEIGVDAMATTDEILAQGYVERHTVRSNGLTALDRRYSYIEGESAQSFNHEKKLIGAEVQNTMEQHGLGNLVMQLMGAIKGAIQLPPESSTVQK